MYFITALFKKASAIISLEQDIAFIEREVALAKQELSRVEVRLALTETALEKERKAHNLALRRIGDGIFKQAKLPTHFVTDAKEPEVEKPRVFTPDEIESITHKAEVNRQADIDDQLEPIYELDWYIEKIKPNPDEYQFI